MQHNTIGMMRNVIAKSIYVPAVPYVTWITGETKDRHLVAKYKPRSSNKLIRSVYPLPSGIHVGLAPVCCCLRRRCIGMWPNNSKTVWRFFFFQTLRRHCMGDELELLEFWDRYSDIKTGQFWQLFKIFYVKFFKRYMAAKLELINFKIDSPKAEATLPFGSKGKDDIANVISEKVFNGTYDCITETVHGWRSTLGFIFRLFLWIW